MGTVTAVNTDKKKKVGKEVCNFLVHYMYLARPIMRYTRVPMQAMRRQLLIPGCYWVKRLEWF